MSLRRFLSWRRILVAFAVATIAVVGANIVHNLNAPSSQPTASVSLPAAQQQQPGTTDLQKATAALGPFVTLSTSDSSTPDTQYPAVLLVGGDGTVAASQTWQVPFSATTWSKQDAPQITAATFTGDYVTFRLSTSTVFAYTVRLGQPFVLQSVPQYVMCFGPDHQQYSTRIAVAELLRRHI